MLSPDHSFVVPSISRDMRALYDAHFAFVWRYMAHRGVPVTAIDDLVQNVFRIVREHPSRHDQSRSRAVLVCMVSRQVLREYKKRTAAQGPSLDDGESPTMNFSRHAAGQVLDAVLDGMTETQREVLLLSQGEGFSNRDIADALGVPESVVQQRLESAAKLMQQIVAKQKLHPIWEVLGKTARDARALMDAAQKVRTPTDADRERVFAGMLASSLQGAPAMVLNAPINPVVTQPIQPPVVSQPFMPPPRASEPEPPAPPSLPQSVPPPEPLQVPQLSQLETHEFEEAQKKDRRPLVWGAVAFAAIAMGMAGYGVNSYMVAGAGQKQVVEQTVGTARSELVPEPTQAPAAAASEPVAEETMQAAAEPPREEPAPSVQQLPVQNVTVPAIEEEEQEPVRTRGRSKPASRPHRYNSADEARQLFAAERALRLGESKLALDMLTEMERRYPQSKFQVERDALRAQVLCERGRMKAARKVILELEASNADPPLLAAVDQACSNNN